MHDSADFDLDEFWFISYIRYDDTKKHGIGVNPEHVIVNEHYVKWLSDRNAEGSNKYRISCAYPVPKKIFSEYCNKLGEW